MSGWFFVVVVLFVYMVLQGRALQRKAWTSHNKTPLRFFALNLGIAVYAFQGKLAGKYNNLWDNVMDGSLDSGKPKAQQQLASFWGITEKGDPLRQHLVALLAGASMRRNDQYSSDVNPLDGLAIDISVTAHLAHLAIAAGYLEPDEGWGWMLLNAQKAAECFDNWRDFLRHANAGLLVDTKQGASIIAGLMSPDQTDEKAIQQLKSWTDSWPGRAEQLLEHAPEHKPITDFPPWMEPEAIKFTYKE
ncbi:hypothetical protein MNBD_GAMMA12-1510 [hydrothermal vent metagenome]|uniref:DUF1266 domain-containing protein n=1 Tax=hydrothermal vent metagenome TaxID=652676 RepID=A0A3B0Z131_9ZZZZ